MPTGFGPEVEIVERPTGLDFISIDSGRCPCRLQAARGGGTMNASAALSAERLRRALARNHMLRQHRRSFGAERGRGCGAGDAARGTRRGVGGARHAQVGGEALLRDVQDALRCLSSARRGGGGLENLHDSGGSLVAVNDHLRPPEGSAMA